MSVVLLDTNLLLALAWPNHQFHHAAHAWFGREGGQGWATCALTQLGFVRLSASASFTRFAVSPSDAARLLAQYTAHPSHRFWADAPAPTPDDFARVIGPQQVADAYLLNLAIRHDGLLATFDVRVRSLSASAAERVRIVPPTF